MGNPEISIALKTQRALSQYVGKDGLFSRDGWGFGMVAYRMHYPTRAVHYGVSEQQAALISQVTGAANSISFHK